ncbi:MAG: BREX-1 system phosphatase PglZ type A [Desulfobacteraceae bacterium]|nr:BREX-1 system phosphatase PglZ type A [Desulfobacteraceae bacterium]
MTETINIQEPLLRLFKRHRIVFWYDAKRELRSDFEALDLPDVKKIELSHNAFGVKHRVLREEPDVKFLLYREGPQPDDMDNWLLDVVLAHGEFRTDQASIYLGELGLGPEFSALVRDHLEFFSSTKRREALKALLKQDDTPGAIRKKMLAVCCEVEPRVDMILESLLDELSNDRDDRFRMLSRCGLESFLWGQLERVYGYASETKGVQDFAIGLFKSCYEAELGKPARLAGEAMVFLRRWKDSIRHCPAFEKLSEACANILSIEQDIQKRDFRALADMDYFRLIDQKIISDLVRVVAERTLGHGECAALIRNRRQSHWYEEFRHLYEATAYAAGFIHALDAMELQMDDMATGIERYAASWYKIDQLYRKFIYHARSSGQTSLLEQLSVHIEDLYTNRFLLQVNDNWQQIVDGCGAWKWNGSLQRHFFRDRVKPFLKKNKKIFVIISDALRYEIGEELLQMIQEEDRYEADITPMLAMLPSYTQLGMAALLPNASLQLTDNGGVWVDGASAQGTENRGKILARAVSGGGAAVRAEELLALNKEACRELAREHQVVYVYHNRIDALGDKKDSEEQVFEAVEKTLAELIKVIKKLTAANANNMLITSDHGFIYQHRAIDVSDFAKAEPAGDSILYRDRRFVLGKGLTPHPSLCLFKAGDLGLEGDMEIQIPKSINRLRLKGSGSRYVHGGAALQEIVVPVIRVNKKRQSDVSRVDVDILRQGNTMITSGQLSVTFYQTDPVTEKNQKRILRAGIYTKEEELISDSHELIFDYRSENPRERELPVRFLLSRKADEANGREVVLRLDEQQPGTSHFKEYRSLTYLMRRSFTSDFDF